MTMETDFWATARIIRMPGVQAHCTLQPGQLTVRTKNAVMKHVKARAVGGGYRAKASALARALLNTHDIPFINAWGGNIPIRLDLPEEARLKLAELYQADAAASMLEGTRKDAAYARCAIEAIKTGKWPDWTKFADKHTGPYDPFKYLRRGREMRVSPMSPKIRDEMLAIIGQVYANDRHQPTVAQLVERIKNNEPIVITKE